LGVDKGHIRRGKQPAWSKILEAIGWRFHSLRYSHAISIACKGKFINGWTDGSLAAAPSSLANFWGSSRIEPLFPQHDAPAFPRPRHVYHALVRRAAEPRRRVAQFMHVSPVNQYIAGGQQSHNVAVIAANQFLVREARVRHHVPAEPASRERDLSELAGLRERLAAGKCDPAPCFFCAASTCGRPGARKIPARHRRPRSRGSGSAGIRAGSPGRKRRSAARGRQQNFPARRPTSA